MMNKKLYFFIGILLTCFILTYGYASWLKNNLKEKATAQSSDHSEVLYGALVLDSYHILTYIIIISGALLSIAFIYLIRIRKKMYNWTLACLAGIAYIAFSLIFYKYFF